VLKKSGEMDMFEKGDILHYGQKIRLEANPYLFRRSLWLNSQPLGPSCYSPVSRKQEASMALKEGYNGGNSNDG